MTSETRIFVFVWPYLCVTTKTLELKKMKKKVKKIGPKIKKKENKGNKRIEKNIRKQFYFAQYF